MFATALDVKKSLKVVALISFVAFPVIFTICQIGIDVWIANSGLPRESIPDVYTEYMAYYEIAGDVLDVAVLVAGVICSGIFSRDQVAEA